MVTAITPYAIVLGASAAFALFFYSLWNRINAAALEKVKGMHGMLDRSGFRIQRQELVLTVTAIAAIAWVAFAILFRPGLVVAVISLACIVGFAILGTATWIRVSIRRRLERFVEQLELAVRLMASGLRVGLGLQQSLVLVTDELGDPAKYEYQRVLGQTNIGVSLYDAFDDLAMRMPSHETTMLAQSIRIASQTGGDLAGILEGLAATIKERRKIRRKIGALTSEGRMSAAVLMLIPVFLGTFIAATQPDMRHALLFTTPGHVVIAIIAVMECLGYLWLKKILRVDVQ